MTYTGLVAVALIVALGYDLGLVKTRLVTRKAFWLAYAILFGFQLLANGILTGFRIVVYAPSAILGIRLAYAPVEDLGFGFALILLTLASWVALGRRAATRPIGSSSVPGPDRPRQAG